MGNVSSMARASTALDSYVAELGHEISYDKGLSSSRFMKTILARHADGPVVLKIFIKPDPSMSLRLHQRRLKHEREALADLSGANTYQMFVETEKAGYLIRQWIGSNLYDRVSIQPYLASIEKKWIAFQLLTCLRDARNRKVSHGDVKSENVLITSDLTVLLTDFSYTFKPTYLPIDDPSDFSFFFDTSGRRTCYLAPERFEAKDERERRQNVLDAEGRVMLDDDTLANYRSTLTEEMDVFSAGCVLAEMWTDGRTVFNLSELFAYRDGALGLEGILDNIEDRHVRQMITQMLSRHPAERPKFDLILAQYRGTIFPEYFYTFLEDYMISLAEPPAKKTEKGTFSQVSAASSGTKMDRMLSEWDSISVQLEGTAGQDDGPALLLLNIVTSSIRNCTWPSSKLHALQLFLRLNAYISDEDKIDRIIPFTVDLLSDLVPIVRAEACRTLVLVVESVSSVTPINAAYIPEYLLPQLRQLAADEDVFVRATYARGLVRLADAALSMLEYSQAAKAPMSELESSGVVEPDYDAMLLEIQSAVEEQATLLLTDPSVQVKRATLSSIADLCLFFGRQKSNETVLSHLVTYLNDRDWTLRLAFFEGIVGVGAFIGLKAVEEYILPLMQQALSDPEEAVVARVLTSLTSLASLGLLARMRIWDIFQAVRGLLCHPDTWIRQGAVGLVAAAAKNLPPSDVWCILYPALRTMLRSDILVVDEPSMLSSLLSPLSRAKFIAARAAALEDSPPGFWRPTQQKGSVKAAMSKSALSGKVSDSSAALQDKNLSSSDEKIITAMKDFIFKQAHSIRARESFDPATQSENALVSDKAVSLEKLGVTAQTVFISPRTVEIDAKADLRRLRPLLASDRGTPSRKSSFASKSHRGPTDNPLDEIRQRLADFPHALPIDRMSPLPAPISTAPDLPGSPSESVISDLPGTRSGKRRLEGKAAPAVAASHANAIGTTSVHEDLFSGRTTPTANGANTPRAGPSTAQPHYGTSYDGHDPSVRAFLEQVDLENYREPLLDFGPRISAAQKKRSVRTKSAPGQGVTLIAHLTQHVAPITAIVSSPDHVFFATASEDKTVMIWDTGRLERSVATKARLVYAMDAPVSALCRIENTHCLAVAAEDGQIHVLRVHVAGAGTGSAKYTKIEGIRSWSAEEKDGYVTGISHLQDSTLLIITSTSVIALLDIRGMTITQRFQHPLEMGAITAFCQSQHWLIAGSELGILGLWDLRFGLLLKSWRAGGAITSCQLHPSRGRGRWVMCGVERDEAETPLVEVYDIETSKLVEVYDNRSERIGSKESPYTAGEEAGRDIPSRRELVAELAARQASAGVVYPQKPATVLSVLVGHRFASLTAPEDDGGLLLPSQDKSTSAPPGYLITAGEDRVVRYFDLPRPSNGMIICGSPKQKDVLFRSTTLGGTSVTYTVPRAKLEAVRETLGGRQPLRPHYDAICALGTVETGVSSCVISGDRSGVVKVWRVEGAGK
ncbi:uncharacterized protein MKK02DRAFT_25800 [Dioszegia hungarica]|uniref:non-specific serine/threonine protein kinase n=1 Tax=Dioszegia hungarica TaxID=4972 RepID=A0AA38HAS9_9TREE|nr:uncharacterized protein MKK02DRAFT_25800 [Dioszegia hungarica]KAI9635914.1 hypothetical protein MKK02DRAFT_25800 [Dioszegia hungarica]